MCASRSALKSIGMFDAHQYLRLEASREVPMPYELELHFGWVAKRCA